MKYLIVMTVLLGLLLPLAAAPAGSAVAPVPAAEIVGGTSAFWCIVAGVATGVALLSGQVWAAAGLFIGAGLSGCI